MLMTMLGSIGQARVPPLTAELGMGHFTGVMLNVPRLINDGMLSGPAGTYTGEVLNALTRIFGVDAPTSSGPEPAENQPAANRAEG